MQTKHMKLKNQHALTHLHRCLLMNYKDEYYLSYS